jgi:hypothetical protein
MIGTRRAGALRRAHLQHVWHSVFSTVDLYVLSRVAHFAFFLPKIAKVDCLQALENFISRFLSIK